MDSDFHWLVSWFHQRTEGRRLRLPGRCQQRLSRIGPPSRVPVVSVLKAAMYGFIFRYNLSEENH